MAQSHRKGRVSLRTKSTLLQALDERHRTVSTQFVTMILPPYAALDAIQRGYGSQGLVQALGPFVLFSAYMCAEKGWRSDACETTENAVQFLSRVIGHLEEIRWRRVAPFDASVYEAICACLKVLESQIETARPNEVQRAYSEYVRWLAKATVSSASNEPGLQSAQIEVDDYANA